jgi:phosphate transport system substrate-binding protein
MTFHEGHFMPRSLLRLIGLLAAMVLVVLSGGESAIAAASHAQITGSGSSWAANALNQWIADVTNQGLKVTFTSTGSAQGRKDFAYKTTDFGVTDIPYQGTDPQTGLADTSLGRPYAYLPVVGGGTSFPYHLDFGGRRISNLRLSGETLAKIFTNQITYWDDKEILADNNNALALPHLRIIPVVHSEGSGSTAQFTRYLAKEYPSIWAPFNGGQAAFTEYFPRQGQQVAQDGSDGVMNFITSQAGNGSIGFDEYSYALLANFPVAKVLNTAGYYTAPTQYNVAVALTQAQINDDPTSPDYLTQDLDDVYTNPDKRTYPLSSYSYVIIPTGANGQETKTDTTAQRQTLSDFLYYSICQGQGEIGPIGYSSLPINLVTAGFAQIAKLKAADPAVDLTNRDVSTCNNPTFIAGQPNVNHLAVIAPNPPSCDDTGQGPCVAGVGVVNANPSNGKAPAAAAPTQPTAGVTPKAGSTGAALVHSATKTDPAAATAGTKVDPITGQLVSGADTGTDTSAGSAGSSAGAGAYGVPTNLADTASTTQLDSFLAPLAIVLLVLVLVLPVAAGTIFARRARARG